MKKIISVVLILVLVLSVGTMAFADSSAVSITKNPTDEVRFIGRRCNRIQQVRLELPEPRRQDLYGSGLPEHVPLCACGR